MTYVTSGYKKIFQRKEIIIFNFSFLSLFSPSAGIKQPLLVVQWCFS